MAAALRALRIFCVPRGHQRQTRGLLLPYRCVLRWACKQAGSANADCRSTCCDAALMRSQYDGLVALFFIVH
jgi:hypothetical protein